MLNSQHHEIIIQPLFQFFESINLKVMTVSYNQILENTFKYYTRYLYNDNRELK